MRPKSERGFTLIELLVVIAIIGTLSAVVLAALNTARGRARDAARISDMRELKTSVESYYAANGRYPGGNFHYTDGGTTCGGAGARAWSHADLTDFFGPYIQNFSSSSLYEGKCLVYSRPNSTSWRCYPQETGTANPIDPTAYEYLISFAVEPDSGLSYTTYPRHGSIPNARCILGPAK